MKHHKLIVTFGFAFVGLISALVIYQINGIIWDQFRLPIYKNIGVPGGLPTLVALGLGFIIFYSLLKNKKSHTFTTEVVLELSKVTWPVRKETLVSTVVVIVMVGIASLILLLYDSIWGWVTKKLLE